MSPKMIRKQAFEDGKNGIDPEAKTRKFSPKEKQEYMRLYNQGKKAARRQKLQPSSA